MLIVDASGTARLLLQNALLPPQIARAMYILMLLSAKLLQAALLLQAVPHAQKKLLQLHAILLQHSPLVELVVTGLQLA